jgi:hypothetical protein
MQFIYNVIQPSLHRNPKQQACHGEARQNPRSLLDDFLDLLPNWRKR